MTLKNLNPNEILANVKSELTKQKDLDPNFKSVINLLILLVELLIPKLIKTTSKNSNLPPSMDLTNSAKSNKPKSDKKPGAQLGHVGKTLDLVHNPDQIIKINIDKKTLPKGKKYTQGIPKKRQVTEIKINRFVIEYQAEVLVDENHKEYVASFPHEISNQTQYGNTVKSQICYFNVYQMLPFQRTNDFFASHNIPISEGSIDNILNLAYEKLTPFKAFIVQELIKQKLLHADETGANVNGKNAWVHCCSNNKLTYLFADLTRGKQAMDLAGVLPNFTGMLVHDHWKAYLAYENIRHIFCNDHISRELQWVIDSTNNSWSIKMQSFLQELNKLAKPPDDYLKTYDDILSLADMECPEAKSKAQSKQRNLIKRLKNFKDGTLAFADDKSIPFTNNQAERDLRMLKVKLKISGCFKTLESLQRFCLLRSFVSTCTKNNINIHDAFNLLFSNQLDSIIQLIQK